MTLEPPSDEPQGATPPSSTPPRPADDSAFGPLFATVPEDSASSEPASEPGPAEPSRSAGLEPPDPFAAPPAAPASVDESPDRRFGIRWTLLAMPLGLALVFGAVW